MRPLALLLVASWALSASATPASETLPYAAFVAVDDALVRSGPGADYYATDRLPHGAKVEVHRRDPGGWLAIRPPETSFSWVPSSKLWTTQQSGVSEVVADDALSWVGSRVENVAQHKWQVRLNRGELVQVLGEKRVANAVTAQTETWQQIVPPAGEFRWIQDREVSRTTGDFSPQAARPPTAVAGQALEDSQVRVASLFTPAGEVRRADLWQASSKNQPAAASPSETSEVRQATDLQPVSAAPTAAAAPPGRPAWLASSAAARANANASTTSQPASAAGLPGSVRANPMRGRQDVALRVTPDDIRSLDRQATLDAAAPRAQPAADDEFADLETQLSLMVAKEPTYWHLDKLRTRAEALVDAGGTPLERGRARLLVEKIEQFEDLQRRHIQVERQVAIGSGLANPETATPFDPRFDGSGWLVPVHSAKRVAPPYALMDDNGKVLHYVSPAPGLNLNRYVRKRVGIYGQKGAAASLNAPHLTAHRVIDMERHATR